MTASGGSGARAVFAGRREPGRRANSSGSNFSLRGTVAGHEAALLGTLRLEPDGTCRYVSDGQVYGGQGHGNWIVHGTAPLEIEFQLRLFQYEIGTKNHVDDIVLGLRGLLQMPPGGQYPLTWLFIRPRGAGGGGVCRFSRGHIQDGSALLGCAMEV